MVMVFEGTEHQYSMDGYLKSNLDIAKNVIKKDWDMVFLTDGSEGAGKSVITQQMAFYCDPTLTIDRIVFTPETFERAILKAQPYQSVVFDEAYRGLSSRATMSMINRALVSMLAEIRQKNLFVFVVMPTFFDLDKYVALWRSRALIHVYTGETFQRGFFTFYNADRKKSLYVLGKKFYNYGKPQANFYGRFVNHYTVDESQYRKKKKDSLIQREQVAEDDRVKEMVEVELRKRILGIGDEVTHSVKARILGMPESTYYVALRKFKKDQELEDIKVEV